MLLNIAFSLTVRQPPLGTNFALFYATGIIPFFLFTGVSGAVASAIATNQGLLHYPVVSPLDAVFGKFILNFLTMLVVGVLLTRPGSSSSTALPVTLDPVSALTGFPLIGLLGLGIGTLNCVLFGLFPTWRNVWNVLTKPLFIVSGTFFIFESAPPAFQHDHVVEPAGARRWRWCGRASTAPTIPTTSRPPTCWRSPAASS